jgi:ATP-dependent 26S proteasome regulatory subunit
MPAQADRVKILSLLLKRENVDESVSIEELARLTEGYSGSDLKVRTSSPAQSSLHFTPYAIATCRPIR